MNARQQAIARQDQQIADNVAKIEAQRPRHQSALAAMSSRLQISQAALQNTLRNTVFRDANDDEFAALIVVANEYKLNPLTKEIFAFKAKGGGIIPYVSVDGWIRIVNEHPAFDGMEFVDIVDQRGNIDAIECIIYRKDRSRPTKVIEYLDECVRETEPWRKSPKRFLRHRALMQCARVAFGFSGISAEDDYETVDGGQVSAVSRMPRRDDFSGTQIEHQSDMASRDFGNDDGAREPVLNGRSEEDEETARMLDEGYDPQTGEFVDEEPQEPSRFDQIMALIMNANSKAQVDAADAEFTREAAAFTANQTEEMERELAAAKRRLRTPD